MRFNLTFSLLSFLFAFILIPAGLCEDSASKNAIVAPHFEQWVAYSFVREELIKNGWKPVVLAGSDVCMEDDMRCANRPEMNFCSDFGNMPCVFVWRKENYFLKVVTGGTEGEAEFDSLEIGTDLKSLGLNH